MFSTNFQKNTQISNFVKIRPMGSELFYADGRTDGQTDMTKLIMAFRNFANASKSDCRFLVTLFCIIPSTWPNMRVSICHPVPCTIYHMSILEMVMNLLITLFYIWSFLQFLIALSHDVPLKQIYFSHEPPV